MGAAQPKDVDAYIANCPENVRGLLKQVRATIRRAAPDADEAIKYGIPTFVQGENWFTLQHSSITLVSILRHPE